MTAKSSGESWQSRAKLNISTKDQRLNPLRFLGESGGDSSGTYKNHIDTWIAGAADFLVHQLNPGEGEVHLQANTDGVNYIRNVDAIWSQFTSDCLWASS